MKIFDSYNKIPDAQRGAVDKFALPATVALATLAVLAAGGNIVKNNVADTMEKNIGNSLHNLVTGEDKSQEDSNQEDKSQDFSDQLEKGFAIINEPVVDIEKPTHR